VGGKFVTTDVADSAKLGDLLRDSINYARRTVRAVTSKELSHATPCREWDLRTLLNHLNDSLLTLCTARSTGKVGLEPVPPAGGTDDAPLTTFDRYSALLLARGPHRRASRGVLVVDLPLAEHLLVAAGAIEISVHGWDVGQTAGRPDPLPDGLAIELLAIAALVVNDACRFPHFGPVVAVPPASGPATRLLAYLGRQDAVRLSQLR
jgi:uncharacterized protein (TIGR03086 family)